MLIVDWFKLSRDLTDSKKKVIQRHSIHSFSEVVHLLPSTGKKSSFLDHGFSFFFMLEKKIIK